jgi:hypothetical protein
MLLGWVVPARWCDLCLVTLAAAVVSGCMPTPMSIGFVDLDAAERGSVDVQGQIGAGANFGPAMGGGGVAGHAEPFVGRTVSFPIGTGLGVSGAGRYGVGHLPLRVGMRHRAVPGRFAWGLGLGPSVVFDDQSASASGVADVELVVGTKHPRVGFSFATRPAVSFEANTVTLYGMLEPTVAIPIGDVSLTLGLLGGPWLTPNLRILSTTSSFWGGFIGTAIGIHRRY